MKIQSIFVLAVIVLWMGTAANAKYSGGTGSPENPYRIATPEDMQQIGANPSDWNKHFILVNDVNLASYTGTQFNRIGTDWDSAFTGVFDGNNHKVWNLTWYSNGIDYVGLFGWVGGQITNLGLENVDVNAVNGYRVGGLVGYNDGGTITNCYSSGSVSGNYDVGGLVGKNSGTITNCYSTGSVTGTQYQVGGLVGENWWGMITDCYSTCSVRGTRGDVGGLVGYNHGGTITNCYSTSTVSGGGAVGGLVGDNGHGTITNCCSTGNVTGNGDVGGIVGHNEGMITNCYSTGSITGTQAVGGLVGCNMGTGTITNCYSTDSVTGTYAVGGLVGCNMGHTITNCYSTGNVIGEQGVGGLVGDNWGTIMNCYSSGSVSGNTYVGGLVGREEGAVVNSFWDIETSGCSTSAGGTPKTTAEMKTMSTFTNAGWGGCGSNEIWTLDEGNDYPRLAWEGKPGQPLPKQELSDFLEGSGTDTDPYLIYTAEQLNLIGLFPCEWDKNFMLAADINIADYSGTRFNIIGIPNYHFIGVFDGNDHKIWNFTWTSDSVDYVGLFGYVGRNGQIKNLGLEKVSVCATNAFCVGGLVGSNYQGTLTNCYSTGSVLGRRCVGGLVGLNGGGTIANCYSIANVVGDEVVGGLVGYNDWPNGGDGGRIANSYSSGNVSGNYEVGGLVGENYFSIITNCYSIGSVSGADYVGGLLGDYWGGTITASFWDIQTSGQSWSDGGISKTTTEMKTMSPFTDAGWDFIEIWGIGENQTYPFLLTDPAGDSNHDKKVDFVDLAVLASHWLEGTTP
jgi:hypothetical protein